MRIKTIISATTLLTITQLCCALPTERETSPAAFTPDALSIGSVLIPRDSTTDSTKRSESEIDEKAGEVKDAADKKNSDDDVNMGDIIDVAKDAGPVLNHTLSTESQDEGDKAGIATFYVPAHTTTDISQNAGTATAKRKSNTT